MGEIPYDIKLNGLQYLLASGAGYHWGESPKAYPSRASATSNEFSNSDDWSYWGQSNWLGQGQDDWIADGPYYDGYGIDLSKTGQISVAKQLAQSRAAASMGWVVFPVGKTRMCAIGKTTSTMESTVDGTTWVTTINIPAVGVLPTNWGISRNIYYVGGSNGRLYSTTDGLTFTDKGAPAAVTTPIYILGAIKSKLYVGSANQVFTFDGTTFVEVFVGLIDGTPTVGANGSGGLFFTTAGPYALIFFTDGNQLHQMGGFGSDFLPKALVYTTVLLIFGHSSDEINNIGIVWKLGANQLEQIFTFGDTTKDYGIRSAIVDGLNIVWGANNTTGVGVYDATLDLFQDVQTGFYVGSTIDTITTGIVDGICQFAGKVFIGIQGQGIYGQTTPGTYRIRSSLFSGQSKNINKLWHTSELHHTALGAGQTVNVKALKDGVTVDSWGTSSTLAATSAIIAAPATYKSPYLQYELSGTANGLPLAITSIALAYIEAADNPKHVWSLAIFIEGTADRPQKYRDGSDFERDSPTMKTELDGLWNKVVPFEDIDGKVYPNVMVKLPEGMAEDIVRSHDAANTLAEIVIHYKLKLVEL